MKINRKKFIEKIKHGGMNSFYRRCFELGVEVRELGSDDSVVRLRHGKKTIYTRRQTIPLTKRLGGFTRNKTITKDILNDSGISVPRGVTVTGQKLPAEITKLRYPLIAKPLEGTRAKGVTWSIQKRADLSGALKYARKFNKGSVLVEEMFIGDEYRVLVYRGKVISALHKVPAGVTGDGASTIKQLIKKFNETRRPGFYINLDKTAKETLKKQNMDMNSVLGKNVFFAFRHNLNMSDGGRAINKIGDFNKAYKDVCVKAVEVLGLEFGGVDILVKNSIKAGRYVILEVNPNPYYNMHEAELAEGKAIDVSGIIIKNLFPSIKL